LPSEVEEQVQWCAKKLSFKEGMTKQKNKTNNYLGTREGECGESRVMHSCNIQGTFALSQQLQCNLAFMSTIEKQA
jgi:hypothetical protein